MRQARWVLLLFLVTGFAVRADTFAGRVVRVLDGDTVEVLDADNSLHRVRLAGIDAPEKAQPFGNRAKQNILDLVGGQAVEVEWSKLDRYGRTVGKLICAGQDANLAMVSAGLAWWYRQYASEQSPADRGLYETAETKARGEHRGLWTDPAPVPPWNWRHQQEASGDPGTVCPCGSVAVCTGPKGGHFCVTENGKKRYRARSNKAEVDGQ
jgi:micrococcal nuclease